MKKASLFFLTALLVWAATPVSAQTPNTGWYTANPEATSFAVSTADELAGLAQLVNDRTDNFFRKTVTLAADIDLSGYGAGQGWTPIGNVETRAFAGTFEGGGKTISGLFINTPNTSYVGLFGNVADSGKVKNLGVVGADVTGKDKVGGLIGWLYGYREVSVPGSVMGPVQVGSSVIVNCHFSGTVRGGSEVGGVVGFCFGGVVENSYSAGTVSGNDKTGGVVGFNFGGDVKNCYSTGAVSGVVSVGGVAGELFGGNVKNCYSAGAVSGSENGRIVGGVVGQFLSGSLENCYSISPVKGAHDVGGVVGASNRGPADQATNCAALNPSVAGIGSIGRVNGMTGPPQGPSNLPSYNVAFSGMDCNIDNTLIDRFLVNDHGTDISATQIHADGTIGGLFTSANGWTTQNGKLPGLLGKAVDMPEHLSSYTVKFDLNGGAGTTPATIRVAMPGGTVSAAQKPVTAGFTKDGYTNDGKWYFVSANAYTEFVFGEGGTVVNDAITLYLQWKLVPVYTVRFDPDNICCAGTNVIEVKVPQDNAGPLAEAQKPSASNYTKAGYMLVDDNWYIRTGSAPNFTYTKFIFGDGGTVVDRNMTLYLQWRIDPKWYDADIAGAGTSESPYIINNAKQLAYVALMVNESYAAYCFAHYRLDSDIDLSGYGAGSEFNRGLGWIPIGALPRGNFMHGPFAGVFDGNAHKITGLYINDPGRDGVGLFGRVAGTVSRVGLEGVNIIGRHNTGGIAGVVSGAISDGFRGSLENVINENHGKVTNVYVTGAVSGQSYVGGVAGQVGYNATVGESYSTAAVSGAHCVGGIVGTVVRGSKVYDNVALNPSVITTGVYAGRVSGSIGADGVGGGGTGTGTATDGTITGGTVTNGTVTVGRDGSLIGNISVWDDSASLALTFAGNLAFDGMLNRAWDANWARKGAIDLDGEDLSLADIQTTPDLNGKFTAALGYSIEPGRLPGYGAPVPLPFHLGGERVPVTTISGVPAAAGMSYALFGAVYPADASHRAIVWSIIDADTTGAAIANGILSAQSEGTIVVRATIADGADDGADYTQDFTITLDKSIITNGGAGGGFISVQSNDRVIPPTTPKTEAAIIAPVNRLTGEFTAGPNPVSKNSGKVYFFRQGKRIDNGVLTIYSASGSVINKIKITDKTLDASARRPIGSWDLTDRKGRPVAEGTYLVKGSITASDGKKEKVSLVVGVR